MRFLRTRELSKRLSQLIWELPGSDERMLGVGKFCYEPVSCCSVLRITQQPVDKDWCDISDPLRVWHLRSLRSALVRHFPAGGLRWVMATSSDVMHSSRTFEVP